MKREKGMGKTLKTAFFIGGLAGCLCLAGCSSSDSKGENTNQEEEDIQPTTTNKPVQTSKPTSQDSSSTNNKSDEKLAHIQAIYDRMRTVLSEGDLNVKLSDSSIERDGNYYEFEVSEYDAVNKKTERTAEKSDVSFYINEDETVQKSFRILIVHTEKTTYIKDLTEAVLLALDEDKNKETAAEEVRQMVESLASSTRSQVVQSGDYSVFLEADSNALGSTYSIKARHKDEVNTPVDKSQYRQYSREEMLSELNKGENAVLTGTIVTYTLKDGEVIIADANQEQYHIYYNYDKVLMYFEIGQQYTFYGSIAGSGSMSGEPGITLDYYE